MTYGALVMQLIQEDYAEVNKQLADIQRAAKDYFVPDHATVLVITPSAPAQPGAGNPGGQQ